MNLKYLKKCEVCTADFYPHPSRTKAKFCSRKCQGINQTIKNTGEGNPHWKGGRVKLVNGRIGIYAKGDPRAKISGGTYILEYRLIAEQKIGRMLRDDEIVHHLNSDPTDNSPENLEVMTQSEHAREHGFGRRNEVTGKYI